MLVTKLPERSFSSKNAEIWLFGLKVGCFLISKSGVLNDRWRSLAVEIFGETPEKRASGIAGLKRKAQEQKIELPFLADNPETAQELEDKFWLMVLRSGGMNVEAAFKVLTNFLTMLRTYPQYFASSNPPHKLDFVYQEQVSTIYSAVASSK